MLLTTLPPDGLRPILRFLDFDSLVNLYATFDLAVQRSLSAPNSLQVLRFQPVQTARCGVSSYFLRAVRDVYRLELAQNSEWSAASYPLLLTLNPVELVLEQCFASGTLVQVMDDFRHSPQDSALRSSAQNATKNGYPDLRILTPRLRTVVFDQHFNLAWKTQYARPEYTKLLRKQNLLREFQIPPTVTSFHARSSQYTSIRDWQVLNFVPSSIERLNFEFELPGDSAPFKFLLRKFQLLSQLCVDRVGTHLEPADVGIPKCLEALEIRRSPNSPQQLLEHPSVKASSLTSLALDVPTHGERFEQINLNLGALLPSTLTSLSLKLEDPRSPSLPKAYRAFVSNLPPTLITLSVNLETPVPNLFDSIGQLSHLTVLNIRESSKSSRLRIIPIEVSSNQAQRTPEAEVVTRLALGHLPASLKILFLHIHSRRPIEPAELASLPTGLVELHTDEVCAYYETILHQRSPACRVFLTNKLN